MKTPLYAKHDCGCGYSAGSGTFFMCPMHEAAAELLAALEGATVPVSNPSQHYCEDWDEWFHGVRAAAIAKAKAGKG